MIRRYYATKDNTITNAFEENLTTRGTGSNMGASDIVEVFSIYGQDSGSSGLSSEKARTLIEFDVPDIIADRAAGLVPASGSVTWYLKMFNAPHSQTIPSSFTLQAKAVSAAWEEGYGLDMEFYEDLTKDGVGSNWINRTGDDIAEITKFTFSSDTHTDYGAAAGANYIKLYNATSLVNFWFNDGAGDSAGSGGTWVGTTINSSGSKTDYASDFSKVVNAQAGFSANVASNIVYVTASTAGVATAHVSEVGTISGLAAVVQTSGTAATAWTTAGGDYHASPAFTQTFSTGLEDLSIDISSLVEEWIKGSGAGGKDNYGLGIKLTDAHEAEAKSFFTKKFFGRDSEFHFQKPVLEARWDSARRDDRGSFYASSSLAPAADNLNTLYLYNRIRGRLRDIPDPPTHAALRSTAAGSNLVAASVTKESTGVYKTTLSYATTASTLYDVWYKGSTGYHTGSVTVKSFAASQHNPETSYVLSMPGLKKEYRKNQTHRLDLYTREKNWSPNIYTVAVRSSIPSLIMPSASFQLRRAIDDYVVVPYGTGSTLHTGLSYDVSGNYFDLDTTYLEAGYLYEIQYSFYDEENGWEEQPYRFKFRVVD